MTISLYFPPASLVPVFAPTILRMQFSSHCDFVQVLDLQSSPACQRRSYYPTPQIASEFPRWSMACACFAEACRIFRLLLNKKQDNLTLTWSLACLGIANFLWKCQSDLLELDLMSFNFWAWYPLKTYALFDQRCDPWYLGTCRRLDWPVLSHQLVSLFAEPFEDYALYQIRGLDYSWPFVSFYLV